MSARSDGDKVIEQAEKHVRGGRIKEAIAEYEKLSLAIAKKINRANVENALKLGDLYAQQGFVADAKKVYASVASRLAEAKKTADAVAIFEKIVKLDREDSGARRALVGLFQVLGNLEAALDQLNEMALVLSERGRTDDAVAALNEALALRPGDSRSVVTLVEVHKRAGRPERAVEVLERELEAAPGNVQFLNILGNIHFEAGEIKRAEEIFTRIVTGHPLNVNARVKLGRIRILEDKLDQAYELFEPLVNNLVKKHRDEKAIGLLGLILESQKPHLPALERLALIYRSNKEVKKLEVVDRAILDELRKRGLKDRMATIYGELLEIRPDDADLAREARALRQDQGLAAEEIEAEAPGLSDKDREAIREVMEQADLYLQQGLVRISRRLLENLRFRYPEDPQILRKIAVLDEVRTHIDEEEIRRRVEKTTVLDAEFKEKMAGKKAMERRAEERKPAERPPEPDAAEERKPEARPVEEKRAEAPPAPAPGPRRPPFKAEVIEGEKISTADIFAETDIIPFVSAEPGEKAYPDLGGMAALELGWLAAARALQLAGEMSPLERALTAIVAEFRKDLAVKGGPDTGEAHYQLGLAFMGQGLTAEAVEELVQAAEDPALAVASYSLIGQGFRQKRNFGEAAKWLQKGLDEAKPGSDQYFALTYELADVAEAADDWSRAAALFREVRAWKPGYRNVGARLERLESASAG
jgi:tetratricopeptide (TPR) repeat protein